MTDYLVGTGGWSYLHIPHRSPLKAYSEIFNFTEVNYTFYEYPSAQTIEKWSRTVPKNFTFSIRCHQDLTHKIGLKPTTDAYRVLDVMLSYCKILKAPYLIIETPANYEFTLQAVAAADEFLENAKHPDVTLVWEARAPLTQEAKNLMLNHNIVQCVDLSRQTPLLSSEVLYTRLFGKGKHNIYQFSDEELKEIDGKVKRIQPRVASASFHGARMLTDALRFITYQKTGSFPSITDQTGAASAKKILAEDAVFPNTKQGLMEDQGWKVFDATSDMRIHLSDWLKQIPDKTYNNLNELTEALEAAN